jgi:glutaminyl-tRNA synthetase
MNKPVRAPQAPSASNFIRQVIEADLAAGTYSKVQTRFPPEPNGYLHFGHVKSICLNFGIAQQYGGACNLRFDDTNPEKEEQEYVDAIKEGVKWLGFDWGDSEFYASDYFEKLYQFAEALIEVGKAYVDSQSAEQISAARGNFTEPGKDSPWRNRSADENLALFRGMRDGQYRDGSHVLRAKIDMRSPNLNLRDPVMYRIRHAHHHRTGDKWCIYPTYDWAHGLSDCLEGRDPEAEQLAAEFEKQERREHLDREFAALQNRLQPQEGVSHAPTLG